MNDTSTRPVVVMSAATFAQAQTDVGIDPEMDLIDWLGTQAVQVIASTPQFAQLMVALTGAVGANDALLVASCVRLDSQAAPGSHRGRKLRYWYFPGLELF